MKRSANFPPANIPRPSPPSSPANLPPSTSPPKNASSIASSTSPPPAPSNPPTTFPTAASPSRLQNRVSPQLATNQTIVIPSEARNLLFLSSARKFRSAKTPPPNTPSSASAAPAVSFPSPPQTLPPFSQLRDNIMSVQKSSAKSPVTPRSASNCRGTQPSIPLSMTCAMSGPILSREQ